MTEPEAYNYTPFACEVLPLLDTDGTECRVAIVKATYALSGRGRIEVADEQRPVRYGDEMWGPPEIADVKFPGDLCAHKVGTDVVVVGHACAPRDRSFAFVDVSIRIGSGAATLRAFGERVWERGLRGLRLSEPTPTTRVALRWGLAFGGFDDSDPDAPLEEPRNPVGRGIRRDSKSLSGQLGPQVEDPRDLISTSSSRPTPAGCAPLGRHFEPRRSHAGTHDAQWLQTRYPARPRDYRLEHENCAPPNFIFTPSLRGGERVSISNMRPEGMIEFAIPRLLIEIEAVCEGKTEVQRPQADTVVVDADASKVEVVWRAAVRYPTRLRNKLTLIRARMKEYL